MQDTQNTIDYYLFNNPSIIDGVAENIDFFGGYMEYNESPNGNIADEIAVRSDWETVGTEINMACSCFLSEK